MKISLNTVRDFIKGASDKRISVYAAGSAFFVMLSVVPIIIVVSCILPFIGLTEDVLYEFVTKSLPDATKELMFSIIRYVFSNSIDMLPMAVILAIWSAGRGMMFLIHGLNEVYDITEQRGYFKLRMVSSFYMVLLLIGLVFTLLVSVLGQRFLLTILVLSMIFTLLYTYAPDFKTSFRERCYGGSMAAIGCTVFSYGFSIYVDHYNDFSGYGSINTIIILMLWFYFTMYILLYCAYVGNYFSQRTLGKETKDEN